MVDTETREALAARLLILSDSLEDGEDIGSLRRREIIEALRREAATLRSTPSGTPGGISGDAEAEYLKLRQAAVVAVSIVGPRRFNTWNGTSAESAITALDAFVLSLLRAGVPAPPTLPQWAIGCVLRNGDEHKLTVTQALNARSEDEAVGFAIRESEARHPGFTIASPPVVLRLRAPVPAPPTPGLGECRIAEYDGAYKCFAHDRKWGAITNPDEPCAGWDEPSLESQP